MNLKATHSQQTLRHLVPALGRAAWLRDVALSTVDPQTTSRAWPGAHPLLAGSGQFELFAARTFSPEGRDESEQFRPAGFQVRRIRGEGTTATLAEFFARWHYEGRPGMRGPAFGLYWADELVGLATFARICNPNWADITFAPSPEDLVAYVRGELSEQALAHRVVAESEYLELNRLALVDPDATPAPLLRGASSWFVAQVLSYYERRNRALWLAETAREQGRTLPPEALRLLARARLDEPGKGLGFLKAVVSFADPWEGHAGYTYQALSFHHAGRTSPDGSWEAGYPGLRSGRRISKRTLQKARKSSERGHDTAALRLLWEGGRGEVRIFSEGGIVHTETPDRFKNLAVQGFGVDRAIDEAWRSFQKEAHERYGPDIDFEVVLEEGGYKKASFPPKHRYLRVLGASFWRHEVERRCVYLRDRMLDLDRQWKERAWGPRPEGIGIGYPKRVPLKEVRPELRPSDTHYTREGEAS